MLLPLPLTENVNPYAPFVYSGGSIRDEQDGWLHEADIWQTAAGWCWSAARSSDKVDDDLYLHTDYQGSEAPLPTEDAAVRAAIAWLTEAE